MATYDMSNIEMINTMAGSQHIYNAIRRVPRHIQKSILISTLMLSDLLMIALAGLVAYWIRFSLSLSIFQLDVVPSPNYYQRMAFAFILVTLSIFYASGLYNQRKILGGTREYEIVFRSTSLGLLLVIVASFLFPNVVLARGWILLLWVLSFVFVSLERFAIRRVVYWMRKQGYLVACAVIIGANKEGYALANQLMKWETSGLYIVGFVDQKSAIGEQKYSNLVNLGNSEQLDDIIERFGVEELILVSSALSREEIVALYKEYGLRENLNLRLSSGLFELVTTRVEVGDILNAPLVRVNKVQLTGLDRALKFILDYTLILSAMLFIVPLLLLICILIKLDSPGPIIHRRKVMGKSHKEFYAYKFRTMYTNGDEILDAHPGLKEKLERDHKLKEDPRITRVGKFLRQSSLDEIPQLWNVIKREMSVVGPRMITNSEMEMYKEWGINLLTVNPGITGLWQVSGRSDTTYEERVQLDMEYIRTWTIWSDLYILWLTIPAILKQRGAY
ncbi:MAG: glycosyl transferase [Chloroflexi bacterium]|nr:MAG: glycosyl transferase [Chloroflexota bacterium]